MLHTLNSLLAPAVMGRLTLVINHVLGSESAATSRLMAHSGRTVESAATSRLMAHSGRTVELLATAWPPLLPPPPLLAFRVTPAGLLEWCGPERGGAADLAVRVDTSNPALLFTRALSGELPPVEIDGDATLAADVNWLMQNLRWDVEADLERVFGPLVAPQLHRLGSALAGAMKVAMQTAMQTAGHLGGRLRPRA